MPIFSKKKGTDTIGLRLLLLLGHQGGGSPPGLQEDYHHEHHQGKKKLSPSAKRRNQNRKKEFLKKKHQTCSEQPEKPEEKGKDKPTKPQMKFNCDLCEFSSSTKHGVSVHMGHTHKVESLRDSSLDMSLETSLPSEEREPDNNSTPVKTKDTDNDCEVDPDAIKAEWIRLIKEIADTDYRDEKRRRELRIKKFDLNDLADEHGILL